MSKRTRRVTFTPKTENVEVTLSDGSVVDVRVIVPAVVGLYVETAVTAEFYPATGALLLSIPTGGSRVEGCGGEYIGDKLASMCQIAGVDLADVLIGEALAALLVASDDDGDGDDDDGDDDDDDDDGDDGGDG